MEPSTSREEVLFAAALERKSPDERAAFLQRECADDPALRGQVEQLLRHHEAQLARPFLLDQPQLLSALMPTTPPSTPEGAGSFVGPYKLLQEIGEGGMGVVYMAEQAEPVRRMVALKIIKPGMDTRQVVARFEAERQALALFDHPNITKVLDAGATETGRPYFVMELVRGTRITDYCNHNRLPIRARIALLIQVCQAVQHAHQKGVIHRDLKPSNILVTLHDGVPVPRVIDFGIAKALNHRLTERTLFTPYAEMIGTPEYMSPEQAEMSGLDIDTRSDVYSLGTLLYELLTGSTPLDPEELRRQSYAQMQETIRTQEIATPSSRVTPAGPNLDRLCQERHTDRVSLWGMLRGDLDWVIMKALSKDRTQRYSSASEFARDLQRYLDGEPVEAAPPSRLYRLRKLAAKHRSGLIVGSLLASVLLVSSVVSVVFGWKALQAEGVAQERMAALQTERDRAVSAERRVRQISRQRLLDMAWRVAAQRFSSGALADMLADDVPGLVKKLLVADIWQLRSVFMKTDDVSDRKGRKVGSWKGQLSLQLAQFEDACLLELEGLGGERNPGPDTDSPPARAPSKDKVTKKLETQLQSRLQKVRPEFFKLVLEERRKVFGWADETIADALDLVAASLIEAGQPGQAESHLRESLAIRKQLREGQSPDASPESAVMFDLSGYCRTMTLLGKCLLRQRREREAKEFLLAAQQEVSQVSDANPEIANIIERLLRGL
jgi:serine/threonine protein kinase